MTPGRSSGYPLRRAPLRALGVCAALLALAPALALPGCGAKAGADVQGRCDRCADAGWVVQLADAGKGGGADGHGGVAAHGGRGGADNNADAGYGTRTVEVLLDGVPVAGATVLVGGEAPTFRTGPDGRVAVNLDEAPSRRRWTAAGVDWEVSIIATHPRARSAAAPVVVGETGLVAIRLDSFDPRDNEAYVFEDSGTAERNEDTRYCSHCHGKMVSDWSASAHARSASNPVLHDVFSGSAAAWNDEAACLRAGGTWKVGPVPGSDERRSRCYVGAGTLADLNASCGGVSPCEGASLAATGACADCHAPAIDGRLGGRSLLEARGLSFEGGVSCDLCHKVESIALDRPAGVAGRLRIVRPSEMDVLNFRALTFGPLLDVVNERMGASPREHFRTAEFCAGCHELGQPVLLPGQTIDRARWPDGTLPIHSTYSEWKASGLADRATCQSCHMPPAADALLAAENMDDGGEHAGTPRFFDGSVGWPRSPGAVRRHVWSGPKRDGVSWLRLAASVQFGELQRNGDGRTITASVLVKNVGPGHALPTGEPMRNLVLAVEASCGAEPLPGVGGDAVPDFGGYLERRVAGSDGTFASWSKPVVGAVVRVVRRTGGHHDYRGHGPFGDGRFDATAKGMPVEHVVGERRVVAVSGEEAVLDGALPKGDIAYLVQGRMMAGAPGFGFARVLAGANGADRMVPHHAATDVVSDNRLLPFDTWTSRHVFASSCAEPVLRAALIYRAYPHNLARQRGWNTDDLVIAEVRR